MEPGAWRKPSPRLHRVRHVESLVPTVVVAVVVAIFGVRNWSTVITIVSVLAVLVAGAVLDVLLQRRVAAWRYQEREDDLLVQRGLMIRRLSVVPYGRMQFVDVTAGPVERSFGLATVRLHTAAAATDARIPGLEAAEAARLRDQLAALGESRAAGL